MKHALPEENWATPLLSVANQPQPCHFILYCPALSRHGAMEGKRLVIAAEVDQERLLTHELHKFRAQKYEELAPLCTSASALKELSQVMGITGSSPLLNLLPYVDRGDVFCSPFYHTAILGVGKAYLRLLVKGPHRLQIAPAKDAFPGLQMNPWGTPG
jgi:hypothetical protein